MADRSEAPQGGGVGLPLLAAASLFAALFVNPEESFALTRAHIEAGAVEADGSLGESRLWHDPLTKKHAAELEKLPQPEPGAAKLRGLMLAVPSTDSYEDREVRRETRYALHSAMTGADLVPTDAARMRTVEIALPDGRGMLLKVETFGPQHGKAAWVACWLPERRLIDAFGKHWPAKVASELEKFVEQPVFIGPSSTDALVETALSDIELHSPWVTGADVSASGESFICQDKSLAAPLQRELERRGVVANNVLLVLERDSSFARSWLGYLSSGWEERGVVHDAWFSRGLYGARQAQGAGRSGVEMPVGQGTVDYLRRLRQELRRNEFMAGVQAVGIFGRDILDKLLIIQALRPAFPEAVFFTSDLHAFYSHPTQLPHTRNMLVASGHGLLPKGDDAARDGHEAVLTPFRDVYQTSTFLAIQAAVADADAKGEPEPGLVFEIGSRGPVELSATSPGWTMEMWSWIGVGLLVILLLVVPIHLWLNEGVRRERRRISPLAYWACKGGIAYGFALCLVTWHAIRYSAEPSVWFAGVSVWPTEMIRLFALMLAFVFAAHALRLLHTLMERRSQVSWRHGAVEPWPVRLLRWLAEWVPSRKLQGHAQRCCDWLAGAGRPVSTKVDRASITALVVAFLVAWLAYEVLSLLGMPHRPIRGDYARVLDGFVRGSLVVAMLWLGVLVLEIANQCIGLLRAASRGMPAEDCCDVDEWRAQRTFLGRMADAGGKGIYGLFFVILLLCVSRWSGFDGWTWPIGLKLVLIVCAATVLVVQIQLHRVAVRYRDAAIANLKRTSEDVDDDGVRRKLEMVREDLVGLTHGVFAGVSNHPVTGALIIPFTGIGGLSLIQYAQSL